MTTPGTPAAPRWPAALLALAVALVWSVALVPGGPSFDDLEGVAANPLVNGERSPAAALVTDYWHHRGDAGHLRPLAVWSLALDHRLYGGWWPGYHLTSVLLHALLVGLAARLLLLLAHERGEPRRATAWLVGLGLAACHPTAADAVAWISARSSSLALVPALAAALLLLRLPPRTPGVPRDRDDVLALGLTALGLFGCLLGKEDGYVGLAPLVAVLVLRRRLAPGLAGAGLGLVAWLGLRTLAYGSPLPTAPYAPLANLPLGERLAEGGRVLAAVPRLLLTDPGLDPAFTERAPADLPADLGWGLWLVAWLAVLPLGPARRASGLARAGLAAALLAWVPYQGWIPAGELLAPRFLYLPLLLAAPWVGEVLAGATRGLPRPLRAGGLVALVLVLVTALHGATRPYGSLEAFHRAQLERAPGRPESWNGLGLALEEAGNLDAARRAYARAVDVSGDGYGRAHTNLGRLALDAGDPDRALGHFERAAELGPRNPVAWANLGRLRADLGDPAGAAMAYGSAVEVAPGLATAWRGLCRARLDLGDAAGAEEALDRAAALAARDPRLDALRRDLAALGGP